MTRVLNILKYAVTALIALFVFQSPIWAQDVEIEALLEGLQSAEPETAVQIEARLYAIWSNSGSPSMDLLLERGREALNQGDTKLAIQHLTALIDHAPDFAEAYNARATAFFQNGQFGLSLEDIRQTLNRNPNHFGAIGGLALILETLDRPEDALAAWREVEQLHPHREGMAEAIERLEKRLKGEVL